MPCADPPNALSKKWLGDIIRKPASATTSTLAGSPSSAWAPSIASRPAVSAGSSEPRGLVGGEVGARADDPERPVRIGPRDRRHGPPGGAPAAAGAARSPAASRAPSASRTTSSLRSSLRSMLRCRGRLRRGRQDLESDVALAQPRDVDLAARRALEEVAAPQQRVGVEVGDPQRLVKRARTIRGVDTAAGCVVTHSRASVRPTRARPTTRDPTAVAAPAAPTASATPTPRLILADFNAPSGPRRGTPASVRRARARSGRIRAARPRSRARRSAPGAAPRSPRCRGAGRP